MTSPDLSVLDPTPPSSTDPVQIAASSLFTLAHPPHHRRHPTDPPLPDHTVEKEAMQKGLQQNVADLRGDDSDLLETMLAAQAQMLHHLFAQAVEKYSAPGMIEHTRTYSQLALKSQAYCRQTLHTLTKLREGKAHVKRHKSRNELVGNEKTTENQ